MRMLATLGRQINVVAGHLSSSQKYSDRGATLKVVVVGGGGGVTCDSK